ncbi:hypothetical protein BGX28_009445 [Mortierella sp. GBA30]|nr:hypothetical protein BGX28_009445 [Mortierella sp. GBA30]
MKLFVLSVAIAATTIVSVSAIPVEKRAASNGLVIGYWVPWGDVKVSELDMSKYTHINYGFGVMTKKAAKPTDITFDRYYDGGPMRELVKRGNAAGVPILMSLGGWTGSETFSTVVADPNLRKTFINNAMIFVRKNTLPENAEKPDGWDMDGIDIDWEYPGRQGAPCNSFSSKDSANYLLLLKELRAQMDKEFPSQHKYITAAVRVEPFDDVGGTPMKDVSAFVPYFDWISVMAYDIMGDWSGTTGPNAPFNTGKPPADPFSFVQAIKSWTSAGWPKDKLVMGTAFYGRSLTATVNMDTQVPVTIYAAHTGTIPKGGPGDSGDDLNMYCLAENPPLGITSFSGQWKWKELRTVVLVDGPTTPVQGWTRNWDQETGTPWLFKSSDKTFISYDDIQSLGVKVNHVKANGLRGVMLWDISYDYNGELVTVLNQVRCTNDCPPITITTATAGPTPTAITTKPVTTTAAVTKTTSAVTPTGTPGTGNCAGVPAWDSTAAYSKTGTKVTYNRHLWTNQWWTKGEAPSGDAWSVWKDEGVC